MPVDVKLPQLGQTMEEGTVVNCLVKEGDEVKKGDVLFEIETDKATLEMESPAAGFVKKIVAEEGETYPINSILMFLGKEDEQVSDDYVKKVISQGHQAAKESSEVPPPTSTAPAATPESSSSKAGNAGIIRLPQLGQTMEEGTIVNCLVKAGDKVSKGDVIFEVETDKATLEMESPAGGFVKNILVQEGDTLAINSPLMIVGEDDGALSDSEIASLTGGENSEGGQETVEKGEKKASSGTSKSENLPEGVKVVRLPQLGQTMEEGTVVSCAVKEGDSVSKGDVLFEIETDKATLEMESPESGIVKKVLTSEGETLNINAPLIILVEMNLDISEDVLDNVISGLAEAESLAESLLPPHTVAAPPVPDLSSAKSPQTSRKPQAASESGTVVSGGRIFASPRAKMRAKELGVELAGLKGSGPGGRIVEADVVAAGKSGAGRGRTETVESFELPAPTHKLGEKVALSRVQKITGQKMLESKQNIPCFYLTTHADVTGLVDVRSKVNKKSDVKVSYNDFIIKALARALERFPIMTGQLKGDSIEVAETIDIGLAIAAGDDLYAPVLRGLEKKSLSQIAGESKELISKTRDGKLGPNDLSGGCTTVSNLGAFGIDFFVPIVVPGQCSILGVGKITDTCVPIDGSMLLRKQISLTLSVDHRVANGAYAAQFLDLVKKLLENPDSLV